MTVQITLSERGKKIFVGLKKFGERLYPALKKEIKTEMERAADEARAQYPRGSVQGYNVKLRPKQRYVRTGTYGRGIRLYTRSGMRQYTLRATAKYSRYVGGDAQGQRQAKIHRGRWPLIRDAVDAAAKRLFGKMPMRLREIAQNLGIGL